MSRKYICQYCLHQFDTLAEQADCIKECQEIIQEVYKSVCAHLNSEHPLPGKESDIRNFWIFTGIVGPFILFLTGALVWIYQGSPIVLLFLILASISAVVSFGIIKCIRWWKHRKTYYHSRL